MKSKDVARDSARYTIALDRLLIAKDQVSFTQSWEASTVFVRGSGVIVQIDQGTITAEFRSLHYAL